MTDHLAVARDGQLRLYRMNGHGAQEVASVALSGALPDDQELAAWSAALAHMTQERAPQGVRKKAPAKALPKARRTKSVPRKPESIIRQALTPFLDAQWHGAREKLPEGLTLNTWKNGLRACTNEGWLEKRFDPKWKPTQAGRQPLEYRLTDDGLTKLSELQSQQAESDQADRDGQ